MSRRKSVTSRLKDNAGRLDGVGCLGLLVVSGGTRIKSRKFIYVTFWVVLINNFPITTQSIEFDSSFYVPYNLHLLTLLRRTDVPYVVTKSLSGAEPTYRTLLRKSFLKFFRKNISWPRASKTLNPLPWGRLWLCETGFWANIGNLFFFFFFLNGYELNFQKNIGATSQSPSAYRSHFMK